MIPRTWLAVLGAWTLGEHPMEALAASLPRVPRSSGARPEAAAISLRLASRRRPGRGGPWLPAWAARWLRSPGCRQYAVVLVTELRRAGHAGELVVGAGARGAHAWVEVDGRAYDLARPAGIPPAEMARDFPVTTRIG